MGRDEMVWDGLGWDWDGSAVGEGEKRKAKAVKYGRLGGQARSVRSTAQIKLS